MELVADTSFAPGERARPEWLRHNPRAWVAAVATVCFGAFMGQLDASIVALTYDSIGASFHAGLRSVQWVSLTYLISLGVLLVPLGRFSDRNGRKRVYLWGFGLFTAASAGCALAPSLAALAAVRAVQGVGAAMLQANSVAIVATAAPRSRLRTALGMQASAQAVGLALGPTVGGVLVQTIGWRWVFAVNVPVGLVAMVAGRYLIPRTRIEHARTGRARDVFAARGVPAGLIGALLAYLLLFGPIVLVPAVLQPRGLSALAAGLVVAALPVGFALGALASERLLPAGWPPRRRCLLGMGLTGAALLGLLPVASAGALCTPALLAAGLGLGVFTPTNNSMIMSAVPARSSALAGGLVSAARAAGTAAGTALVAMTLAVSNSGVLATGILLVLAVVAAVTVILPARGNPFLAR
jgi:MFS family permease